MKDVSLRKAVPEDAAGVANVLISGYNINSEREGIEVFELEKRKGHDFIVAEKKGKIIGLITWKMHGLPKHGLAELDRIVVLPDYRGKGIAKMLFEAMIDDMKKFYSDKKRRLRKIVILTHADNSRAQAFYKKLGFKHETTLKSHYYDDKDEFVFSIFV